MYPYSRYMCVWHSDKTQNPKPASDQHCAPEIPDDRHLATACVINIAVARQDTPYP